MSDTLPPLDELLAEFDSGKVPRSDTWQTLITGLYLNTDNVNEIEGWYNTVQELTNFNQTLGQTIKTQHDQIEIWYGQVDSWQQQVSLNEANASQSASAAAASQLAAEQSEINAGISASAAAQSATEASHSEGNAQISESNADHSASQAASSEQAAAHSAAQAATSASNAQASETAAGQSATEAADSATTAESCVATLGSEVEQASQSATIATEQATLAQAWAANPLNDVVENEQYSSLHYAIQSSEYADASSANAYQTRQDSIDAENAKREALNSASAASTSESNAADSATNAKTSETAAAASAKDANLSKVSALASENNAGSAASSALASRESAATAASTATQQANRSESEADRSEAAAEKINREGIPIGSILPYYGSSAPMGWLGLTKGATIRKADYPALFKHLTDQRKPPHYTNIAYTLTDGKWLGDGSSYVVVGNSVARLEIISGDRSNAATLVSIPAHISGDPFPNSGTAIIYGSLIDIPLPNEECFLPDAANNFIKGYEPTGTRPMGTFEQDAIREVAGTFGGTLADNVKSSSTGAFGTVTVVDNGFPTGSGWGFGKVPFNASRVVPTGPENVPKNLNCLWIIKAYDAVNDPEQLQAKAVIDQVNGNSSDILAINGELDRIDYALLDFGTVTKNTVYIQSNPFGASPVICKPEVLYEGVWYAIGYQYTNWGSSVNSSGVSVWQEAQSIKISTGSANTFSTTRNISFTLPPNSVTSSPCRVHVWRVKG